MVKRIGIISQVNGHVTFVIKISVANGIGSTCEMPDQADESPFHTPSWATFEALYNRMDEQISKLRVNEKLDIDELFSFTRNGMRMGLASIEDEMIEALNAWEEWRHNKIDPMLTENLRSEILDIAAVAMHIYGQIPGGSDEC